MALLAAAQLVELREIALRDKPEQMLAVSPKGTVPVLVLPHGEVIDESLEIMQWALAQSDSHKLLSADTERCVAIVDQQYDKTFKHWLDRYKYQTAYPEQPGSWYRKRCEETLIRIEQQLCEQTFLFGDVASLADVALMPFVRQFANVDLDWFNSAPYPNTIKWLRYWLEHEWFIHSMEKYPVWTEESETISFG